MTIFQIDAARNALIDAETGEITDFEQFEALYAAREEKVENACLMAKEEAALADAIAAEIKTLTERKRTAENNVKRLQDYVAIALEGQKFKTARVAVSYRSSKAVAVEEGFIEWAKANRPELVRHTEKDEPDKTAIKKALDAGEEIIGCCIEEKKGITIK